MAHKKVEETNIKHQPLTETTQYRNAINELEQLHRHHELILQSVGEGVYGLDCEGHTTFVNDAARKMLGWELSELITKSQHDIIHHTKTDGSHYEAKDCPIYAAFKDGKIHSVDDEIFWRKDGTSFPVEYISTPIKDETGNLLGAVVAFKDITSKKEAEEALIKSNTDLQKAIELSNGRLIIISALGSVYAMAGLNDEALKIYDQLVNLSKKKKVSPLYFSVVDAALGNYDNAFDSLYKAYDEHFGILVYIKASPIYNNLKSDQRFDKLTRMIGLEK